ncbi:MAG: hypothetical protein LBD22_07105 [Spirochaetaceae bacterium]|jgi:tetratricopeptide (TPR) repeat protein|nr:hypothetical protein [Spirochaetaceae bacterium]
MDGGLVQTNEAQSGTYSVDTLIREALSELKAGHANEVIPLLESALRIDCEDIETLYALKCINWWLEKLATLEGITTHYDKGYFIMGQWGAFYAFLETIGPHFDRCRYAVQHFVYGTALESFEAVLDDGVLRHDPGLLLRIGRCYKGVGNFEAAQNYLMDAARFRQEDGAALAELADVNALMGEIKNAKVLFREAFFVDPQGIDVNVLESEMITGLVKTVREAGINGGALVEWIPVYGALLGVFSVKRELKLVELGKLNQAVFALENKVRTNSDDRDLCLPRLLNHLIWLLDYYERANEDPNKIQELQLKIKIYDPAIYYRFIHIKEDPGKKL